jgi:hypothetical protein
MTAKKPKKVAKKAAKKATKKATKKTSSKQPTASARELAVDGSQLTQILDLAGARKPSAASKTLATLERQLGRAAPGELRSYLARPLDLDHPEADHPDISDTSFAGALPDVRAWLDQLKKPTEGTLQAIQQLAGLYPLGVKLERGDFLWVFAGLRRYSELDSGGVFYYDGRELGGFYPGTLSGFLLHELRAHWEELDGSDDAGELRDVFHFSRPNPRQEPPKAIDLPAPIAAAFDARANAMTARLDRIVTLLLLLRGEPPHLAGLPTESTWHAERRGLADDHADAMYWLLAHWLFDNRPELAEAVALTKAHRSPLVAALRDHVARHDASAAYGPQQAALFAAVRLAARE